MVLGATGVTGSPLTEHLLASGWRVYGVSRRPISAQQTNYCHLGIDINDKLALQGALHNCRDVTHVFDCASAGTGTARVEALANLLDGLEANVPDFRNINLQQGMKYYGCHLGPFPTPAREDAPRIAGNLFYYDDEDLISAPPSRQTMDLDGAASALGLRLRRRQSAQSRAGACDLWVDAARARRAAVVPRQRPLF